MTLGIVPMLLTAACSGEAPPATGTMVLIEHGDAPNDVIVQIGDYALAPIGGLDGPRVVVYGDGTVFVRRWDATGEMRTFTGRVTELDLQRVLRAAQQIPGDALLGVPATDAEPLMVRVHDRVWLVGDGADAAIRNLVALADEIAAAAADEVWVPEGWLRRDPAEWCVDVIDAPADGGGIAVPLFPGLSLPDALC